MGTNPNPQHKKNILAGLSVPHGLDPALDGFLRALKQHIELSHGSKGQPRERFVTIEELRRAGLINIAVKGGRAEISTSAEQAAATSVASTAEQTGASSSSSSSTSTLSGLSDTNTIGKSQGDVLRYNANTGKWQRLDVFDSDDRAKRARLPGDTAYIDEDETVEGDWTFEGDTTVPEATVTDHEGAINHDALTNFVDDEHIAHSAVTLTAGSGLTGGGTIAASRSFAVDINGLSADGAPDGAADYVMTFDASAAGLKKVLLDDLPGGGGSSLPTDPDFDAVLVWDDSDSADEWWSFTDITAALDEFTDLLQGVVPASGGGTTKFLRADGSWAEPSGGSGSGYPPQLGYAGVL